MSKTSAQIFPKSKTSFSRSTPVQIQSAPIDTIVNGNSHTFFLVRARCLSAVYGLESYSRPAGNRTITGSLSATQECRDTNCTTRTTVNGNSHTIGSNNEDDTPDKRIHRTLPNIHNDWQRNKIYTILPEQQRTYIDMCRVI